jgi:hypothetical protein
MSPAEVTGRFIGCRGFIENGTLTNCVTGRLCHLLSVTLEDQYHAAVKAPAVHRSLVADLHIVALKFLIQPPFRQQL